MPYVPLHQHLHMTLCRHVSSLKLITLICVVNYPHFLPPLIVSWSREVIMKCPHKDLWWTKHCNRKDMGKILVAREFFEASGPHVTFLKKRKKWSRENPNVENINFHIYVQLLEKTTCLENMTWWFLRTDLLYRVDRYVSS